MTTPQIDDRPAVDHHCACRSHLPAILEVLTERVSDGPEAIVNVTVNFGPHSERLAHGARPVPPVTSRQWAPDAALRGTDTSTEMLPPPRTAAMSRAALLGRRPR